MLCGANRSVNEPQKRQLLVKSGRFEVRAAWQEPEGDVGRMRAPLSVLIRRNAHKQLQDQVCLFSAQIISVTGLTCFIGDHRPTAQSHSP